jgi:chitinase
MKTRKIFLASLLLTITVSVFAQATTPKRPNTFKAIEQMSDIHPLYTPYVDVCLWPPFPLTNVDSTGICLYTLAFIVDDQFATGANPCWGGYSNLDLTWYQDQVAGLRDNGGEVIVSFGGASGFPLAFVAANENELKDAYKAVIDAYDLQSIDFDIEGMFVAHPTSIELRSKAMKLLQDEYSDLQISLTLPVMPWGLTGDGINVVTSAVNHDVNLSVVNLMAMDYGGPGDMGDNAISAMEATFGQLKTIYQNAGIPKPDSLIWRMIGVTPMIGQNDVMEEVFYLDDAEDVTDFAFDKKIGRIAMWSANRDRQCENSWDPLYICSHIEQEDFQFSYIFQQNGTISYCDIAQQLNQTASTLYSSYIYPNPAHGYVIISDCNGAGVTITGIEGLVVKELKVTGNNFYLDISNFSPGSYLLFINKNGKINYEKMVVF